MNSCNYREMSSETLAQVVNDQLNLDRARQRVAELEQQLAEVRLKLAELLAVLNAK